MCRRSLMCRARPFCRLTEGSLVSACRPAAVKRRAEHAFHRCCQPRRYPYLRCGTPNCCSQRRRRQKQAQASLFLQSQADCRQALPSCLRRRIEDDIRGSGQPFSRQYDRRCFVRICGKRCGKQHHDGCKQSGCAPYDRFFLIFHSFSSCLCFAAAINAANSFRLISLSCMSSGCH